VDRASLAAARTGSTDVDGDGGIPGERPALPRPTDESAVQPGWRRLLGGTPREVLGRLVQDDPLGVRRIVAARLRADALLLEADRVHLRALASIARFASRYRNQADASEWIVRVVEETLRDLVREDHESSRRARSLAARAPDATAALARPLGLDPSAMRANCAAFNVLPLADRSAFFEVVLSARSLDEVALAAGESATEIARRARRALDVVRAPPPAEAVAESRGEA